jgi:hypothetical protein
MGLKQSGSCIDARVGRAGFFVFSARIRTVENLFPIFFPRFTPSHFPTARLARFAGQALFVAFEG